MKYLLQNSMTECARGKCAALFSLVLMVINASVIWAKDCDECYARPIEIQTAEASLMKDIYSGRKNITSLKLKKARRNDELWKVYSDRAGNKIYDKPRGRFVGTKLSFMDAVFITDVSDDGKYVHVDREELRDGEYAFYPLGWVDIRSMVLTDRALSNKNGISRKGLVLVNLDDINELKSMTREAEENGFVSKYAFYDSPRLDGRPRGRGEKLAIRFVLKELDGAKLLAVNDKISDLSTVDIKNNVNGWMKNINITDWDTRICLETTHGFSYKKEYADRDIPVFIKERQLSTFIRTGIANEAIYTHKIRNKRMLPAQMRMPILENIDGGNTKRVATLGSVDGAGEETDISIAKMKKLLEELKLRRNNINILFVLDATSSMSRYYPAVQRGIQNIVKANKSKFNKSIKFAVSVYRDYEDGAKDHEFQPLTNNPDRIYDFLSKVETRSVAQSVHESVYNGILEGLKKSGMNSNESNIVILIGDAGNHRNDKKGHNTKLVSRQLARLNANFIAFQVYTARHKAYRHFNYDAMSFVKGIGELSKTKQSLVPVRVESKERRNTYDLKFRDPETGQIELYPDGGFARFTFAPEGGSMPISELKQNLAESLEYYLESVDLQIARYQLFISNGDVNVEGANAYQKADRNNLTYYLKDGGMSEDQIALALQQFSRFSVSGYTQMNYYNSALNCYTPVVFLTDEEVRNIIQTFKRIDPRANNADAKDQISDALLATVKAYTGETSDDYVKGKTLAEIWDIILKIPFDEANRYGDLRNMRLEDFRKSKNAQLKKKFILEFQQSLGQFTKSNLREDQFRLNGQYFYWVPLRKIPGNAG